MTNDDVFAPQGPSLEALEMFKAQEDLRELAGEICGLKIFIDHTMSPDRVEFRDHNGRLCGAIVNLGRP